MVDICAGMSQICGEDLYCELTQGFVDVEGSIRYTATYGIAVKDKDGHVYLSVDDVSNDRQMVLDFAKMCECGRVSLVHVMDVLEDYLL